MARKTNLGMTIDTLVANAHQRILTEIVSGLPGDTTLGALVSELAARGLETQLMATTLDELAMSRSGAVASPTAKRTKVAAKTQGRKRKAKFNTRLESGRNALDAAILEFLADAGPSRSEVITKAVGGTTAQVRQAAKRLAKKGALTISGTRRGTTYSIKKTRKKASKGKK
ncbi:MAG TPA: hypothetical protein ENK43_08805 [Planctomycetes bacterium]|nr:hypothetical protein [Planctomycetota bacterium]